MFFNPAKDYREFLWAGSDCLLCHSAVTHWSTQTSLPRIICRACHNRLPILQSYCGICAMPVPTAPQSRCGECLSNAPAFSKSVVAFHYEPPISSFVSNLKFNASYQLVPLLAHYLAKQVRLAYESDILPQQVLPVPLHPSKLCKRGFNQAQLLSQAVAKEVQVKVM